ncbi:MAG: tetratricopeptide repeat protein [Rhodospirillaceae bacterium]|nr:tetratricopeptide repeat protein [Rhodospirillaceae bacterium]MBT3928656.1 tetratricopeptide repeat protein [Rhodospirillaceae bacterium]MBT4426600.1 tetratricopeptide repeat protein [Rhodospirillaceae bacterium]MBT5038401.1 tetratricopeptide repeat protein [Rhodospirillaceae bacterium]MBT5676439.1 tetratricopeptide repeat protein [Rhodospirillaceae bacterium]
MSDKQTYLTALKSIGALADEAIDLAETALILGALDRPRELLGPYHGHLADLAAAAEAGGEIDHLGGRAAFLNRLMFETHGYVGDTEDYDDPQNANLLHVIDRRAGLPVSIGILYIHAARAAGYDITGLAFPGHFLLRITEGAARMIIDPFHGGQALEAGHLRDLLKQFMGADAELTPYHHAPVSNRDILLRLQNNIKARALQENDTARAAEILERMVMFAPQVASVWQELGILSAHLGNLRQAMNALETFLDFAPPQDEEREAENLLNKIKTSLN